jgi:hypothetical protein
MRRCNRTITVLAGLALVATTTRASGEVATTVPYPEGYRTCSRPSTATLP